MDVLERYHKLTGTTPGKVHLPPTAAAIVTLAEVLAINLTAEGEPPCDWLESAISHGIQEAFAGDATYRAVVPIETLERNALVVVDGDQ